MKVSVMEKGRKREFAASDLVPEGISFCMNSKAVSVLREDLKFSSDWELIQGSQLDLNGKISRPSKR
jgi:hypothetical protein